MTDEKRYPDRRENWHLDKRVPITLVVTIVLQTFAVGWFISSINSRVESIESKTLRLETVFDLRRTIVDRNTVKVAVIQESLSNIEESLRRIEKGLQEKGD